MTYDFNFTFDDQFVFGGLSNNIENYVIPSASSGDTDEMYYYDYSTDPENPEHVRCYFNSYVIVPNVVGNKNFIRMPTDTTIEGEYSSYGYVLSEHQEIRLVMYLTHNGSTHTVQLNRLEKFCGVNEHGERVWQGLVPTHMSDITVVWNSDQEHGEECYLAIYDGNVTGKTGVTVPSIGFQFCKRRTGAFEDYTLVWFFEAVIANPAPDPSHSYEPTESVIVGGRGNGMYPSDAPESPDIGALNTAFSFGSANGEGLCYYETTPWDIRKAYLIVYDHSFINVEERINAMLDAFKIPFGSADGRVNKQHYWIADVCVHVDLARPITVRFQEFDMGTVDLSQYGWDDWNDFSNTSASLSLPFVGRIDVDIHAIARGSLRVLALADIYTGNVAYWVYTRCMQSNTEVLYGVYEGQSAVQIPLCGTYNPNRLGKILTASTLAAGGIVSAATGNIAASLVATGALINKIPDSFERKVDKSHAYSSCLAGMSNLQIRLDIERREMLRPEEYREIAGIPAFVTLPLGSLTGFVQVHSAEYEGLSCEQSEKEEIMKLLKEGVYI